MQLAEVRIDSADGWLNPAEAKALHRIAKKCVGCGVIVEIGSWKGKSTVCLARGSRAGRNVKIHAIDPHTGSPQHKEMFGEVWTFEEFKRNIESAGVSDLVVPHVDFSESVARTFTEPVEAIFIDGLHEYDGVKADFDAWFPKVIDGGAMAFHDTTCWPGVLQLMKERVFKSRCFRRIRFAGSIVYGEKVRANTALERAGNRVMLRAFLIHAFIERMLWRTIHGYLDFPITRAAVNYVKKKRQAKAALTFRS